MKTIFRYILPTILVLMIFSCEEKDLITLQGFNKDTDLELITTAESVEITSDNTTDLVLQFSWDIPDFTLSEYSLASDAMTKDLQFALDTSFTTYVEMTVSGSSQSFTGSSLNTTINDLDFEEGAYNKFYIRIALSAGDNIDPLYSNTVTVNIKPYQIDMTTGYILNSSKEETGVTLYSANSNGDYTGFMGASSWYNFYLMEGDGTIWGNDAVTGTAFVLSSEDDSNLRWNCWFPGVSGCYYVDFNTTEDEWSALLIPSLTVSGDITGDMTFDRSSVKWTLAFESTSTSVTIKVSGTGKQYNVSTGTDDASAVDTPVAFAQSGETLTFTETASNITVSVPGTGSYTLTIDLSNPLGWTISAVEGSDEPEETSKYVYLAGIDDGISGSWTFNNYLTLYSEDNLSYAGVVNVNSLWGYGIYTEANNWSEVYNYSSGDAYSGTLVYKGSTNIPAPTAGLYLIETSLSGLTYSLTSVGSVIYISGLNDVWDFSTTLAATSTVGTYSGQITITKASSWGFQIHIDSTWSHYWGGSGGSMYYKGSNITDDASLAAGTYTMTVNLISGTYTIAQ